MPILEPSTTHHSGSRRVLDPVRIMDLLRVSAVQVLRQHRRYLGVVLSIAFGTAGVLAILTMGDAVKEKLNEDLELLGGATVLKCSFEHDISAEEQISRPVEFLERTAEAVRKIPGVASVSLFTLAPGYTTWEEEEISQYTLLGVDEFYWDVTTVKPIVGTFFGEKEVRNRSRVCVLGIELAKRIFGHTDVIGMQLPITSSLYRIIGILGGENARDRAECAFVPFTTLNDRLDFIIPTKLYVRCATWDDVGPVSEALPAVVAEQQSDRGLLVEVPWGPLKHLRRIVLWVELFVYFAIIATISLGGFGIWNGMMTAVKSRTREIGLKKAMGAEDADIFIQFFIEAICLSVGAALTGILFGRGGVELMSWFLHARPPEGLFFGYAGLSVLFALLLGAGAGLFPAIIASRMEVVTAIRYE